MDKNSDDAKKAIAALKDANGKPTPEYETYLKYEAEWKSKKKAYEDAYAHALKDPHSLQMWPFNGKHYQDEVDAAFKNWQAFGGKATIERALAILAAN